MFFLCDFKIYCQKPDSTFEYVDSAYKIKKISENLWAYQTMGPRGKKSNEVKYLTITFSDYYTTKVYEELDG